jgi:hypothetical protein
MLGGGKVFFIGNALVDLFPAEPQLAAGSAVAMGLVVIMRLVTVTLYLRARPPRPAAGAMRAGSEASDAARPFHPAYLFLYGPIMLIVLFSFNSGLSAADFQGFSVKWARESAALADAGRAADQPDRCFHVGRPGFDPLMGTMAALALQRVKGPV